MHPPKNENAVVGNSTANLAQNIGVIGDEPQMDVTGLKMSLYGTRYLLARVLVPGAVDLHLANVIYCEMEDGQQTQ